jgi:hypothetical protein
MVFRANRLIRVRSVSCLRSICAGGSRAGVPTFPLLNPEAGMDFIALNW